ncbi:MAG: leucine-rich repeat protein [Candidatus Methanomethylophilaceae archaeon]|nr:leucine-rich repeat protein [Candidatus Methanomethylophilaceae archaeon]
MRVIGALLFLALLAVTVAVPESDGSDGYCHITVRGDVSVPVSVVFESGGESCSLVLSEKGSSSFLSPGIYRMSVVSEEGDEYYSIVHAIEKDESFSFFSAKFGVGNSGWIYGEDYVQELRLSGPDGPVSYSPVVIDDKGKTIVLLIGDTIETLVTPSDVMVGAGYCPVFKSMTVSTATSNIKTYMPSATDFQVTVPSEASLSVTMMGFDRMNPTEVLPCSMVESDGSVMSTYKLAVGYTYGIRASMGGFADRCCIIKMIPGMKINMTEEDFMLHPDTEVDREVGISDVILNINPEGYMRMVLGDSMAIEPWRVTLTDDDSLYYPFLKPKFHYSAINLDGSESDVVGFDGNVMTALSEGTAFVRVTYEAVHVEYRNVNGMDDRLISASYPESTGLFVVTVGGSAGPDMNVRISADGASDRISGRHWDHDLDVVFYSEQMKRSQLYLDSSYVGTTIQYNPVYDERGLAGFETSDTTGEQFCHVRLVNGPNLIVSSNEGVTSYQVVKARLADVVIYNVTRSSYTGFAAGDEIDVFVFGIGSPASSQFYGSDESLVLRLYGQEYVSSDGAFRDIIIPEDAEGDYLDIELIVRCHGHCPAFGSHRWTDGYEYDDRSADFGRIVFDKPLLSESFNVFLDTMVESGSDTNAVVKTGGQGKIVNAGEIEVYKGRDSVLTIARGCTQKMFGIKSISGPEVFEYDAENSGNDIITIVINPGSNDVGTYDFSIVINLMNTKGVMVTTVSGKLKVLDPHVVVALPCITGGPIVLPNLPGGISVPEGMMFKSWNTRLDGTGVEYEIGDLLRPDSSMVLYATYVVPNAATAFVSDGLRYSVKSVEGRTGTVSLVGCLDDFEGDLIVPSSVRYNGVDYVVENIGAKAFFGRAAIRDADLSAVSEIGVKAFSYCTGIDRLVVAGSVGGYAFFGCSGLRTVEIGSGSVLKTSAFSGCTGISELVMGRDIVVGKNAFYGNAFISAEGEEMEWSDLSGHRFIGSSGRLVEYAPVVGETFVLDGLAYKVKSSSAVVLTGRSGWAGDVLTVPGSVEHLGFVYDVIAVGPKAFYSCAGLREVDLGSVSVVGTKAFARCADLQAVDVEGVSVIESYAFYGCSSLERLDFGHSVTIKACAFARCFSLSHVSFQEISGIAKDAFSGLTFWSAGARQGVTEDLLSWSTYEAIGGKMVRLT